MTSGVKNQNVYPLRKLLVRLNYGMGCRGGSDMIAIKVRLDDPWISSQEGQKPLLFPVYPDKATRHEAHPVS
jgi:hypothetical protein